MHSTFIIIVITAQSFKILHSFTKYVFILEKLTLNKITKYKKGEKK